MTHETPDEVDHGSAQMGVPKIGRMRARTALAAYDRHGDALFSLALLLCRDVDRAVDAVVATATQAHTMASGSMPDAERQRLAADLWRRCADVPHSRLPQANPVSLHDVDRSDASSEQEQALLGLVLFGCHTYGQAAARIGLSAPTAAAHLRSVLRRAAGPPSQHRV